jgi:hypothetical protein
VDNRKPAETHDHHDPNQHPESTQQLTVEVHFRICVKRPA